jgi:hypothetical protein
MRKAGHEFGRRQFFTRTVKVSNLVDVPRLNDVIASQYSEGCYATWEPRINGLITTITGSIRPIEKDSLTDDELAVVVALRPGLRGVQFRKVEGKRNDLPSSESVELFGMDTQLPFIPPPSEWKHPQKIPVIRSKLHGHRGVRRYNPEQVEHVYLERAYYDYPVSCSTEAQANAIIRAFSRSKALAYPDDPRQLIFTVLPGHGLLIVEKWISGKAPFQAIWEAMDAGILEIDSHVPQGRLVYLPDEFGFMELHEG